VREEIIRGEDAIRQAIQHWRQHLITHWRNEPLRLTQATPNAQPPFHLVEFQNGHRGWLGYLGNDARYPRYCGCNLVEFIDGYQPPQKPIVGLVDIHPLNALKQPAIIRIQLTLDAIYDPVLLLFYHLAQYSLSRLKPEPNARRIRNRRTQRTSSSRRTADHYWKSLGSPVRRLLSHRILLTIARERL
jgi:hypothetical protein